MNHTRLNRIVAVGVFLASMGVYAMTVAPTVVFWDVGEFIAAAKLMQVPHPPGSPLFLLWARLAMMIPFAADQAVRAHAVSGLLSAVSIVFVYLVTVKVIVGFRGIPSTTLDRLSTYGGAVIGALSLAYGTTYWDNSIEAEVYGASMFFLTSVMWLALRWRDRDGQEGSEKYILMMAYLIGLSLGVHLLALLAIFPVMMIMYFKRYDYTLKSFVIMGLVTSGVFFVVYPGIVKYIPGMMDGEFWGRKSEIIAWIPWIIIAAVIYGVYTSYRDRKKLLHIGLFSILLIFLGYTTYTGVLIRSNVHPPMNENDPSNLARLTSYLGREQYGDTPFWPRRWSQEPHQQGIYTQYTSEWDYLFRYQLSHMFFRYLGWNFIGAAGDAQDSGVSFKDTLGIPFWVGLFGLYYLFRKDWKMGLVFLATFIIMGPVLALYQNQQEPQPRERDYFYVGAYFVFSLWIAVGIVGILDLLKQSIRADRALTMASFGAVAFFVLAIPGRQLQTNWHEHDRSGNYLAWDYSYNILQSCEKDAILFTNGDNDTFPLWYLQDVEGVRRDVRVVNLSLVNTSWYIKQMKDKPYFADAQAVPISFTDARINNIQPVQWTPRTMELAVPKDVAQKFGVTDTAVLNQGKISWYMQNTMQVGSTKAIRIQDIMVLDIIRTTQWKRPIYFAVTCSPDSRIGLDEYLWFHGLAFRFEPRKINPNQMGIDPDILRKNLFDEPQGFSRGPQYGYKFRGIADPSVYFDENASRLMLNYRTAFVRLALYDSNVLNNDKMAMEVLDRMEKIIPRAKIPLGWELASDLATFYHRAGNKAEFDALAGEVEQSCRELIDAGQANLSSYWNPYRVLLDLYDMQQEYDKAIDLLKSIQIMLPNDPTIKQRILMLEQQKAAQKGGAPDTSRQPQSVQK
jgi:Protein O-mannosyl-transferase TMEM260-like